VLAGGRRAGAWLAERGVAFEEADQAGVGVVEQDEPVAGEVGGRLPGEVLRDQAPVEADRLGGGDRAGGGGPGDPLACVEAVCQPAAASAAARAVSMSRTPWMPWRLRLA
jgi:hypothetical protein